MSKKHRRQSRESEVGSTNIVSGSVPIAEEYRIIRSDLITVLALNALYLAGVLVLYYTNQHSHYLERWFTSIFHF